MTRCHPTDIDWVHAFRHRLMKSNPGQVAWFDAMESQEIELIHWRNIFYAMRWSYGDKHPTTRKAFEDWQSRAEALGFQRIEYEKAVGSSAAS